MASTETGPADNDIAIIGVALRVPGARDPERFWQNICDGVESVRTYNDDELSAAGVSSAELSNPNYVRAGAPLDGMDLFDAEFFGLGPKEAAIMDPQHRQFLECAWEALERAGHVPARFAGAIGVFAGCGMGSYFAHNILTNRDLVESVGLFLLRHTGNDKDFLATRASYCLDLHGPSVNVQTACSTSLVAVHLASQSLLSGECDLALAGGVTIEIPHRQGYLYHEGEILAPDGHCRPFDHRAEGTVFGSGTGVVVLRRLSDALADGDNVIAVIKGSAVNNDGSRKVGYLAPSVDGQAAAIAEALSIAGVSADSIGLVECHGTGTAMGDPIEIAALTQAFASSTERKGYCAVGSVKSNIGHLDTAAGVAALIKAALALQHRVLPASLNFERANPQIDFEKTPFFVNDRLQPWAAGRTPRRAGVNSLGVGGTNAYVVLQEAPAQPKPAARLALAAPARPVLLVLSARNRRSLGEQHKRLLAHLQAHPEISLADAAHTLFTARQHFDVRRVLAASSRDDALRLLGEEDSRNVYTHTRRDRPSIVFMFPGGGVQYPRMGEGLLASDAVYREHIERGLSLAQQRFGLALRPLLLPELGVLEQAPAARELERPSLQLPLLFIVEHALAQSWLARGVQPSALIGHSMGENTAACIAGVMDFATTLGLVALRGQLFESLPDGGMLSVPLSAAERAQLDGSVRAASRARCAGGEPRPARHRRPSHPHPDRGAFADARRDPGRVRRVPAQRATLATAHPDRVEFERHVLERRRCLRPRLLGAPPSQHRALRARHRDARERQRQRPRLPRGGPGPRARLAGAAVLGGSARQRADLVAASRGRAGRRRDVPAGSVGAALGQRRGSRARRGPAQERAARAPADLRVRSQSVLHRARQARRCQRRHRAHPGHRGLVLSTGLALARARVRRAERAERTDLPAVRRRVRHRRPPRAAAADGRPSHRVRAQERRLRADRCARVRSRPARAAQLRDARARADRQREIARPHPALVEPGQRGPRRSRG
jgi:3-oxoacyl-(acyl-carrier-protein) synthase